MTRQVDVLVVGAGPAGLAVGAELARLGAGSVEVLERESEAGGIPRHSHHTGYGLRDLHRLLTGPEYARRRVDLATGAGVAVRVETTVSGWAEPLALDLVSPGGIERVEAHSIVMRQARASDLAPRDSSPARDRRVCSRRASCSKPSTSTARPSAVAR